MRINTRFVAIALALLVLTQSQAIATPSGTGKDAPAIIADVVVCRPLGLMALLAGSTFYVLSLPFTVPARGTEAAKRTLVDYPYHYTFTRPLGEFYDEDL